MTAQSTVPVIEASGIVKVLAGNEVLKGVSFKVQQGTVCAIIGASGSGKSTMLRCLNMLIVPDGGEIRWMGEPVGKTERNGVVVRSTERDLLKYRTDIGMVFQSYNLFPHMTALENIIEAPVIVQKRNKAEVTEEAHALLKRIRLSHRANALPHQMSGGEQQRVAIARALAMRPKALLLDEVTSALDPELKGEVLDVIKDLAAEGLTMVMVSHEMGFVRQLADEVIFMSGGKVCEQGSASELLGNPQTTELKAFLARVTD